jgi:cytochrome b involved in lipid metabolism
MTMTDKKASPNTSEKTEKSNATSEKTEKVITLADLSKHSTQKDCWIAMNGGVYNATDFLDEHPGGPELIMQHAGKDATQDFSSIHSSSAFKLIEKLRIGSLPEGEGKRIATKKDGGSDGGGGSALGYLIPILVLAFAVWWQFLGGAAMLDGGAKSTK